MGHKSCKTGLFRHQQRIQNPQRQNPKRVKKIELRNTGDLEYSRNCAQKSYQKTVQKSQKTVQKSVQKNNIIIHPKKSSPVPLRCVKCDETFKTKFNFDFHLNISQVTSDFEKCKLCNFKSCTIIGLKMHVRKFHAINSKQSMDKKKKSKSAPETRPKSVLKIAPKVEPKLVTIPEPKLVTIPEPKLVTKAEPNLVTTHVPKSEQKSVLKSMSKCASKSGQKPSSISESKLGPNHEQSKKSPEKPDENQNLENENKNKARFVLPRPKKGQWIVRVEKIRITRM